MAYVRTRLGRWFYDEHGAAARQGDATIVLLHSLLCDGSMWRGQVGPLSELGRVLVLDSPGHGKSEVPPPFTLEENAHALEDALDGLGVAKAVIVGLSWGGMLAMRLALQRPERVAAMVLLDTSADGTLLRERVEYRLMCALALRIGLPPRLAAKKVVPLMFAPRTRETRPELVADFLRTMSGFPREGLVRATMAVSIERASIVESLRKVRVPTLVGHGEEDSATPPEMSRRIASHIAGSELVVFPKLGHLSALEDADLVNGWVVPWVKTHLAAPG
jgi:3-oxoadipate enol-lactonase